MEWPIEQVAEALGASFTTRGANEHILRWESLGLGVKLMLDVDTSVSSVRLVIDRTPRKRSSFLGSLVLEQVVGIEIDRTEREVRFRLASGLSLAVTGSGTFQLHRPA